MCKIWKKFKYAIWSGDEGWTFIEATLSIVLLSIIFLGFTITLLEFREWLDRSWAVRVMDQYANDVIERIDHFIQVGGKFTEDPPRNGLGSFRIYIPSVNVYPFKVDSTAYIFFAHPEEGIFLSVGSEAPREFYQSCTGGNEATFPPESWKKSNKFTITDFRYEPFPDPDTTRSTSLAYGTPVIHLSYKYERIEGDEKYVLDKQYVFSSYMKNYSMSRGD